MYKKKKKLTRRNDAATRRAFDSVFALLGNVIPMV
jgi:hypothetical protein